MFSWTIGVLALAAVANGNNLRSNVIKFDSNTDFGDIACKQAVDNLYNGPVPADIPNLVNTGATTLNNVQKIDGTPMPSSDVPVFCNTLPSMADSTVDKNINVFCNNLASITEGELVSQYFKTTIPQGTLNGIVAIIGIAGGTQNGTTTIAYDYGQISTTLIQQTKQVGTECCCCDLGGCGSIFHSGCGDRPVYANRADTPGELADCQNYLEVTLRPNFAPPALQKFDGDENVDKYMNYTDKHAKKTIEKNMRHAGPFQTMMYDAIHTQKVTDVHTNMFQLKGVDSSHKKDIINAYFDGALFCPDKTEICEDNVKLIHNYADLSIFTDKKFNRNDVNVFECISKIKDTNMINYANMVTTVYDESDKFSAFIFTMEITESMKNKHDNIVPGFKCQMFAYDTMKNKISHNLVPKNIIDIDNNDENMHFASTDDATEDYAHALDIGKFNFAKRYVNNM